MTRGNQGRPPGMPELKALTGNPGKRPIPPSPPGEKPDQIPDPPSKLRAAGVRAWRLYWRYGRMWLAYTDLPAVLRVCKLHDIAATIEARLEREGLMHQNPGTKRSAVHHSLNNLLGVYKAIGDLESALGFTPRDRARLKAEAEGPVDPLDSWQQRPKAV